MKFLLVVQVILWLPRAFGDLSAVCEVSTDFPHILLCVNHIGECNLNLGFIENIPQPQKDVLTEIDFSGSSIREIELGALSQVGLGDKLKKVHLNQNVLQKLDLGVLDGLPNLLHLNLSSNYLTTLPLGLFDEMISIEILDLSFNKIKIIPLGIFDEIKLLKLLDLSGNKIKDVPLGLFDKNLNITKLILSKNLIGVLPLGLFDQLETLEYLDFSNCRLKILTDGIFDQSRLLKVLRINRNQIGSIPNNEFDDLVNLEELDLSNNRINLLPNNILEYNKNLSKLSIGNNRLTYLDPHHFFSNTKHLKLIDLYGNPWQCPCFDVITTWVQHQEVTVIPRNVINNGKKPFCVFGSLTFCDEDAAKNEMFYNLFIQN